MDKEELKKDDIFNEEDILKEEFFLELIDIEKKLKDTIVDFYKGKENKKLPTYKAPKCIFALYNTTDIIDEPPIGVTYMRAVENKDKIKSYTTDRSVIIFLKRIYDDLKKSTNTITKHSFLNFVSYCTLHEMVHWYQANYGLYDGTDLDNKGYKYRELICCIDAHSISKLLEKKGKFEIIEKIAYFFVDEEYSHCKEEK